MTEPGRAEWFHAGTGKGAPRTAFLAGASGKAPAPRVDRGAGPDVPPGTVPGDRRIPRVTRV
ncbi:hypothetical protein GCM10017776_25360 [Streptomyces griseoluteus]|nr:hypothetical protein GCM10017776_25360 [Streptomyces griseoluteus]